MLYLFTPLPIFLHTKLLARLLEVLCPGIFLRPLRPKTVEITASPSTSVHNHYGPPGGLLLC